MIGDDSERQLLAQVGTLHISSSLSQQGSAPPVTRNNMINEPSVTAPGTADSSRPGVDSQTTPTRNMFDVNPYRSGFGTGGGAGVHMVLKTTGPALDDGMRTVKPSALTKGSSNHHSLYSKKSRKKSK